MSPSRATMIVNPVIKPKEIRLFIVEMVKMKNPLESTMIVSSNALPVEVRSSPLTTSHLHGSGDNAGSYA